MIVASDEVRDVVDLQKRNRCLRLTMQMEDLPAIRILTRPIRIAATVLPIVRNKDELEHVVVKRKRHLIEGFYILV